MITRRTLLSGISIASASLLTSCGTIIYPDRVNQKNRGHLDPAIIILDGIGLFFFLIPGVIAFAVDFATGAIYFPADKEPDDTERTIFDDLTMVRPNGELNRRAIERAAGEHAGISVDLTRDDVLAVRLDNLDQFRMARSRLSGKSRVV